MGENVLMRSIEIETRWAITLQCDISEAVKMKRVLICAAVIWLLV